jgi:hypothetical protein
VMLASSVVVEGVVGWVCFLPRGMDDGCEDAVAWDLRRGLRWVGSRWRWATVLESIVKLGFRFQRFEC